jgi:hypothetical protein
VRGAGEVRGRDAAPRRLVPSLRREDADQPDWGESAKIDKDTLEIGMVSMGLTHEQTLAAWKPLQDFVAASPSDYEWVKELSGGATKARNWWDVEWRAKYTPDAMVTDPRPGAPKTNVWWKGDGPQATLFVYAYESMWLPAALLKDDSIGRLGDALFAASRQFEVQLHFNKGLAGAPQDRIAAARETAMNPAVLDAFALAIIASGKPLSSPNLPGHEPPMTTARDDAKRIAGRGGRAPRRWRRTRARIRTRRATSRSRSSSRSGDRTTRGSRRSRRSTTRRVVLRAQRRRERGLEPGRVRAERVDART